MSVKIFIRGLSRITDGPAVNYKDLFVIAGQSNLGRSRRSEMSSPELLLYDPPLLRTYLYNAVSATSYNLLDAGTNTMLFNYLNSDEFGFETSLFKSFENADNITRYVVKEGIGSTELAVGWNSRTPGALYTELVSQTANAISQIRMLGFTPRLKGFIWMQGENDATNETWANAYLTNLQNFFIDFQTFANTQGVGTFKKIICRINGASDPTETYRNTVRTAQSDYCNNSSNNAILVDTDDLPLRDSVHYSATGQIALGIRLYDVVKTL